MEKVTKHLHGGWPQWRLRLSTDFIQWRSTTADMIYFGGYKACGRNGMGV